MSSILIDRRTNARERISLCRGHCESQISPGAFYWQQEEKINARPTPDRQDLRVGLACAIGAHTLWGMFPLFWALLRGIPATELTAHRILWAFVSVSIALLVLRVVFRSKAEIGIAAAVRNRRYWTTYSIAAVMIAINWLAFVFAVTNGRVLEASLGYYINPLINVLLGVLILGERLGGLGWAAVATAAAGVAVITIEGGGLPWPALAMAVSFAFYGLTKKLAPLPALEGLWMETLILGLPALGYILWLGSKGEGAFLMLNPTTDVLLLLGGLITILPLSLFTVAARRVPLSTLGLLQYVGPTLQFLVGVLVFGEDFSDWRIVGFVLVWTGLIFYLYQSQRNRSRRKREAIAERRDEKKRPAMVGSAR